MNSSTLTVSIFGCLSPFPLVPPRGRNTRWFIQYLLRFQSGPKHWTDQSTNSAIPRALLVALAKKGQFKISVYSEFMKERGGGVWVNPSFQRKWCVLHFQQQLWSWKFTVDISKKHHCPCRLPAQWAENCGTKKPQEWLQTSKHILSQKRCRCPIRKVAA